MQITVNANSKANYLLKVIFIYYVLFKVTPMLGGIYNGSITFIDSANKDNYIWFTVQLEIERPSCAKRVEVSTIIRKPVIFETILNNPETEEITFDVSIQGEGLTGELQFSIPAKSSKVYELMYLPMIIQ